MILQMLFITIICCLGISSGFFEEIDAAINRKWRFRHLPKVFHCSLCATWWTLLLFIIITGNLTIFNIMLCLLFAYGTKIITPLTSTVENILLGIINRVNQLIEWVFFK